VQPRIVFAYRYGALGGPSTQLLARLQAFRPHFDVRILIERDLGAVRSFPPDVITVAPTFQSQIDAIGALEPDWFVVFDSGWREPWIRAGSPGRLVLEVRTTSSSLTFLDELRAAQRIDLIIVATRYLAGLLERRGLGEIAPIAIVPNIASSWPPPGDAWEAPSPILLWVGRLEPHKGVRRFIDLCDEVEPIGVLPLLVGGVNDTNDEVIDTVDHLYRSRRRHQPIWFPRVRHDEMPRIYASVARSGGMLVITSDNENFPNTAVEATMLDCAVVAPAVGGIPELLPPDALFPPGDDAAASALIEKVLRVDGFASSLATSARAIIEPLVRPENALPAYLAALDLALPDIDPGTD
jgi:glycosyltransferase involved in cell wall biosynthesis